MKFVRVPFALLLVLLAAAPVQAAVAPPPPPKPPAEGGADPDRDVWRSQGLAICVGAMRGAEGVDADSLQATCGCALDRFMEGRPTAAFPALGPQQLPPELNGALLACASDQPPAIAAALARRIAAPPLVAAPPVAVSADGKPLDTPAPADAPKRSGQDFRSWLGTLSLPSWIADSGLPGWAWIMLAFLALALLRGLLRRGARSDLVGPPPHMRLGTRANPPAPPRADPPQRG